MKTFHGTALDIISEAFQTAIKSEPDENAISTSISFLQHQDLWVKQWYTMIGTSYLLQHDMSLQRSLQVHHYWKMVRSSIAIVGEN